MTNEEAKKKICPLMQCVSNDEWIKCKADECMVWVKLGDVDKMKMGQCGLACADQLK